MVRVSRQLVGEVLKVDVARDMPTANVTADVIADWRIQERLSQDPPYVEVFVSEAQWISVGADRWVGERVHSSTTHVIEVSGGIEEVGPVTLRLFSRVESGAEQIGNSRVLRVDETHEALVDLLLSIDVPRPSGDGPPAPPGAGWHKAVEALTTALERALSDKANLQQRLAQALGNAEEAEARVAQLEAELAALQADRRTRPDKRSKLTAGFRAAVILRTLAIVADVTGTAGFSIDVADRVMSNDPVVQVVAKAQKCVTEADAQAVYDDLVRERPQTTTTTAGLTGSVATTLNPQPPTVAIEEAPGA